jgi:hypothetical protein
LNAAVCDEKDGFKALRKLFGVDSAASTNVYNDYSKLTKFWTQHTNYVTADGKRTKATEVGIHPAFGFGVIEPNAMVNLLSLSMLKHRFHVKYDSETDRFVLSSKNKGMDYVATCQHGIYLIQQEQTEIECVMSMSSIKRLKKSTNLEKFDSLHRTLNHAGKERIITALKHGMFKSWGISLEHQSEIDGYQCDTCKLANAKIHGKDRPSEESVKNQEEPQMGKNIHVDVVFVSMGPNKLATYLIGVEEFCNYVSLTSIKDRTVEEITRGLRTFADFYEMHGYKVRTINSDREAGIIASAQALAQRGVELIQTAAGVHERKIESQIGKIRDHMRATLWDLSYRLPTFLYPKLFEHVVQTMNTLPNVKCKETSPRAILTGNSRHEDYLDLPFGTIVITQEPSDQLTSKMEARGSVGILVARSLNSSATEVYVPSRGRVVSRDCMVEAQSKESLALVSFKFPIVSNF